MKLQLICPLLFLASGTISTNAAQGSNKCLTDADTSRLVAGFTKVISETPANETLAAEFIATDFISISDSVNFIDRIPLNTTMTHSLAELLQQESKLPFVIDVKDLFISHTCDTITWYFEFATKPLPTRGIAILFVDLETGLIWKSYRESNSAATLWITGRPECGSYFTVGVGSEGPESGRASCGRASGGAGGIERLKRED